MSVNYPKSCPYTGAGVLRCSLLIDENRSYIKSFPPSERSDAIFMFKVECSNKNDCKCLDDEDLSIKSLFIDFIKGVFRWKFTK